MTKDEVRKRIQEIGIIPAARLASAEDALFAAEAISSGGLPIIEVTMTVPEAVNVIANLTHNRPDLLVGAGTVLDVQTARRCVTAGAKFLTSTGLDMGVLEFAVKEDIVVFPGAVTPTEVMTAWRAGADFIKIFPCMQFGGPSYIKALRAPFPQTPLIASGGVTQQNAYEFITAGAAAIGVGADLIQPDAIVQRDRGWIRELAHRFVNMVSVAKKHSQTR
jgi:2-dehydro-3-deoxyphosphogluconate aldolase/(4S)-4-hydroxy-2-oxoglutarate aldolase